jgi:radical SAM superfamily enzyme YgiQ (UPF0313 family)
MDIKLIFPGRPIRPLEIRTKNHLIPSETLTALAAVTPAHHSVRIADENVAPLHLDDHPDLVGITVHTFLAPRAYAIADAYRRRCIPVALGGLHVSGLPEEALAHADAVFVGEVDTTWPQFLRDFERGGARRIYQPSASTDIASLPRPRRDLLDGRRYLSTASVTATRGSFIGPGHAGIFSENGKDWLSCHYYDGESNGKPTLAILPLQWTADGWPVEAKESR